MNTNVTNILKKVKDFLKPQIALIIAAILLFISIFMPLMTPSRELKKQIKNSVEYAEEFGNDELEGAYKTLLKPSSSKLFSTFAVKTLTKKAFLSETYFYLGIAAGVPIIFIVLIAVFSFLKKNVPVIVLSVINFIVMLVRNSLFSETVISAKGFEWAFGNGFMFFAAVLVVAAAVWCIVDKKKAKKTALSAAE